MKVNSAAAVKRFIKRFLPAAGVSLLVMTAGVGYAASAAAAPDEAYMLTWGLPFLRLGIIGEAGLDDAGKGIASIKPMVTAVLEGLRLSEKDYMV